MKGLVGFTFFLLFLAGFAFVNLQNMANEAEQDDLSIERVIASAWRPMRLGDSDIPAETEAYVQFEADGAITGHGGCNRVFGSFEVEGISLKISPLGSTRMACPEPQMSHEFMFMEILEAATGVVIADGELSFIDDDGHIMATFTPIARQ